MAVAAPNGTLVVDDLDLEVAGGEIVCIAGVQGNGQTELAEALLGVTPTVRGRVLLDGKLLTGRSPREIIDAGLGFVPEDRKHDGFVGTFTVAENLVLNHFDEPPYAKGIALDLAKINENAEHRVAEFDIRTQSISAPTVVAVRRQPAEGGAGPGAVAAAGGADRQPAHPRGGRRRDRVPALSGWSPSATGAPRCSSCPPSWTRWWPWPTGSR